jgi:hypothetical protein
MPSQKAPKPKPARDMTTDEAIRHLFHPDVIEHAKRHASAVPKTKRKPDPSKSMNED